MLDGAPRTATCMRFVPEAGMDLDQSNVTPDRSVPANNLAVVILAVEPAQQCLEVALARRGEERIDHLALDGEICIRLRRLSFEIGARQIGVNHQGPWQRRLKALAAERCWTIESLLVRSDAYSCVRPCEPAPTVAAHPRQTGEGGCGFR